MRVFFIHPLGKNLHLLRKDLHWVNSSINQQSNSSINSKFIGIWSFTIIPIMFYLELLKPWTQDVHNIVWKVFVMACRCSILHSKTTSSLLFGYKKEKDGYWKWLARNLRWGSLAGDSSSIFVYSLDYAQTGLPNDAKSSWIWVRSNNSMDCWMCIRRPLLPTALLDFIEIFFWSLVLVTLCACACKWQYLRLPHWI